MCVCLYKAVEEIERRVVVKRKRAGRKRKQNGDKQGLYSNPTPSNSHHAVPRFLFFFSYMEKKCFEFYGEIGC